MKKYIKIFKRIFKCKPLDKGNPKNVLGFLWQIKFVSILFFALSSIIIFKGIMAVSAIPVTFEYTSGVQNFIVPYDGTYKLEVWGAQGGNSGNATGGLGGYVVGEIDLLAETELNIHVGGSGNSEGAGAPSFIQGGYNGGGRGYRNNSYGSASGGGASDIRLNGHTLNDRIIVAGGGGGAQTYGNSSGGQGGALIGENASSGSAGIGGTQTAGGNAVSGGGGTSSPGTLGEGGDAPSSGGTFGFTGGGGGGGGYYGGSGGSWAGGGGGSNYIDTSNFSNITNLRGERAGHGQIVITLMNSPQLLIAEPGLSYDDFHSFEIKTDDPNITNFVINDDDIETLIDEKRKLFIDTPDFRVTFPVRFLESLDLSSDGHKVFMGSKKDTPEKDEIRNMILQQDLLQQDPRITNLSDIYEFKFYSFDSGDNNYEIIEEFDWPLKIRLKDVRQYGIDNLDRTGVFYIDPTYDNDQLQNVELFFTGNAHSASDVVFTQDHFSFVVMMETDGVVLEDPQEVINSFATHQIEKLLALDILRGMPDRKFHPKGQMNRTHFAIAFNKTMGRLDSVYNNAYNDIQYDDYFAGHIASLDKIRINDTFGQNNFGVFKNNIPNDGARKITRREVAVFLQNAYEYSSRFIDNVPTLYPETLEYKDIDHLSNSEKDAISIITRVRLMQGEIIDNERYFQPDRVLTREECAIVLDNFLNLYNRALVFRVNVQ